MHLTRCAAATRNVLCRTTVQHPDFVNKSCSTWLFLEGNPGHLELFARLVDVGGEESQMPKASMWLVVAARVHQIGIALHAMLVLELNTGVLHIEQPLMGLRGELTGAMAVIEFGESSCWVASA